MKEISCSLPQSQFFPHFPQLNSVSLFDNKRFQIECSFTARHLYWESLKAGAGNAEWKPADSRRNRELRGEPVGQWGQLRELKSRPHVSALKRSVMREGVKMSLRGNMIVPLFYCSHKKLPQIQWLKKHRFIIIQFCRLTSPTQTMPG